MGLPLQMPLALGAVAFAERAPAAFEGVAPDADGVSGVSGVSGADEGDEAPRPEGEQQKLFG